MPLLVAKVHSVAKAPLPPFASGAFLRAELGMVAVSAEAVLPYVDEIIRVDVALVVVGAYAVAAGDGPVYAYRGDAKAGLAAEQVVADLALIGAS